MSSTDDAGRIRRQTIGELQILSTLLAMVTMSLARRDYARAARGARLALEKLSKTIRSITVLSFIDQAVDQAAEKEEPPRAESP